MKGEWGSDGTTWHRGKWSAGVMLGSNGFKLVLGHSHNALTHRVLPEIVLVHPATQKSIVWLATSKPSPREKPALHIPRSLPSKRGGNLLYILRDILREIS